MSLLEEVANRNAEIEKILPKPVSIGGRFQLKMEPDGHVRLHSENFRMILTYSETKELAEALKDWTCDDKKTI